MHFHPAEVKVAQSPIGSANGSMDGALTSE